MDDNRLDFLNEQQKTILFDFTSIVSIDDVNLAINILELANFDLNVRLLNKLSIEMEDLNLVLWEWYFSIYNDE